jgi:hypothetical protein
MMLDFSKGEHIAQRHVNLPIGKMYGIDRVLVRVAPGELVIPRPYAKKVLNFLKEEKMKLPLPNSLDPTKYSMTKKK